MQTGATALLAGWPAATAGQVDEQRFGRSGSAAKMAPVLATSAGAEEGVLLSVVRETGSRGKIDPLLARPLASLVSLAIRVRRTRMLLGCIGVLHPPT